MHSNCVALNHCPTKCAYGTIHASTGCPKHMHHHNSKCWCPYFSWLRNCVCCVTSMQPHMTGPGPGPVLTCQNSSTKTKVHTSQSSSVLQPIKQRVELTINSCLPFVLLGMRHAHEGMQVITPLKRCKDCCSGHTPDNQWEDTRQKQKKPARNK